MFLARVDGNCVATVAHPSLKGWRLLICQPITETGEEEGEPLLVIDDLGAGLHEQVLVCNDSKRISEKVGRNDSPIRYFVIGLVDEQKT